MIKKRNEPLSRPKDLRRQAEEIARGKDPKLSENLDTLSPKEQLKLLHELQVHQIELQMQNESLRQTQEELESAKVRYFNLYDLAPVGYFTLSEEGLILEANLTAGSLLGMTRNALVKKPLIRFIFREDQDIYYHHRQQLFVTSTPQACDLRLMKKDGSLCWVRLESTVAQDNESGDTLCYTVISNITQRKQAEIALTESEEELKKSYQKLKKNMDASINTMSNIIETKDPYTSFHQHRVCQLAVHLAREMKLPEDKIEGIRIASLIHDIGKIDLPTEILSKPTKLTDIEFRLIKDHSRIGHDILKSIDFSHPVAQIVLQHHERINGSGYPHKLNGDKIILEAKIIGVADVVEAMASHRPYRPALGIDAALEEISKNKGILYDPKVVDTCVKLFREKGFKFE